MAKKEQLKKSQLDSLIEEVKGEIDTLLKSEYEKLAKTAPGQESPSEDDDNADVSATAPAAPSPGADGSAPPGGADGAEASAPDASASPDLGGSPDASPDAMGGGDPGMDQSMDHDALVAEYSKLGPEELKAHVMAAKEALMAAMGGAAGDGEPMAPPAPAAAPPAAPMTPPAAPDMSASAPPALKSEIKSDVAANGGKMSKSEKDFADLKKRADEQDEALSKLLTAVETVLGQPQRKAVTSVSFVPKTTDAPKTLSKSEVKDKLNEITKSTKLAKSDRELINEYCLGNVTVEKIEHLLK